jgi:hypothetical protein
VSITKLNLAHLNLLNKKVTIFQAKSDKRFNIRKKKWILMIK